MDDYYQVFVNRYRNMDHAITDPTQEQFDSGATTDLASTRSRDQVSLAAGMSRIWPRSSRDADRPKGNADSSASESEHQHALEVSVPIILPGCLS